MARLSRSEGYRRGAGKEEAGLVVAESFVDDHVGVQMERITDAEENYWLGDLRAPSGATIEVKRQPIDPDRYPQNFVEVFEVTANPRHQAGFADLSELLGVQPDVLAQTRVRDHRHRGASGLLGRPEAMSISVRSMFGSALTAYVNPGTSGIAHIYLYRSDEIVGAIREAVARDGLRRGMGQSNDDTFAVLVPLARFRWSARAGQPWQYVGEGTEAAALTTLRTALG